MFPDSPPPSPGYAPDYSPPKLTSEKIEEHKEKCRANLKEASENALMYYNKKHRTNYELVEGLAGYSFLYESFVSHFNLKAKEKADSEDGSPPKLFFVEDQHYGDDRNYVVTACRILDGVEQVAGCDVCKCTFKPIMHPTCGFKVGVPKKKNPERVYSLRPRPPKRARNY